MKFKADEIASVIQKEIEDFRGAMATSEVGRVLEVGDGIARCYGLSTAMAGEMVEFPNGVRGLCFNLEETSVGIIILGEYTEIAEGTRPGRRPPRRSRSCAGTVRGRAGCSRLRPDHASRFAA